MGTAGTLDLKTLTLCLHKEFWIVTIYAQGPGGSPRNTSKKCQIILD